MDKTNWSENIIIVDSDYVDRVVFDLTVNFERMLGRRIPQADLSCWLVCVALDGGLRRDAQHDTHVVLIHDRQSTRLQNFQPGHYADELNGKAFRDELGEFTISALAVEESLTTKADFITDTLQLVCQQKDVQRIMVVADCDQYYAQVRQALNRLERQSGGKCVTVFAMQPLPGGPFRQEILGYSLMAALGIRGDEIHPEH